MTPDDSPRAGLPATLKAITLLVLLTLAALAGLVVFELIPGVNFTELAIKLLLLGVIALFAAVAIASLVRGGQRNNT